MKQQKLILLEDFIKLSNLTLEKIELKEPVEKILGEEKDDANSENASDKDVEKYGRYLFIWSFSAAMKI